MRRDYGELAEQKPQRAKREEEEDLVDESPRLRDAERRNGGELRHRPLVDGKLVGDGPGRADYRGLVAEEGAALLQVDRRQCGLRLAEPMEVRDRTVPADPCIVERPGERGAEENEQQEGLPYAAREFPGGVGPTVMVWRHAGEAVHIEGARGRSLTAAEF